MLIHVSYAIGIITIVSLIIGFTVSSTIAAKPSEPSPIEQECIEQGVDPELAHKCEHPFS